MTDQIPPSDLLTDLAGIAPNSELAAARATRRAATLGAQASYEALFQPAQVGEVALTTRLAVAAHCANLHQDRALAKHYHALLLAAQVPAPSTPLQAALDFATLLTLTPVRATAQSLVALQEAHWSTNAIVTLAQIIAFVSFQSRMLTGLQWLNGKPATYPAAPLAVAGSWHQHPRTATGQPAPVAFTQQALAWEPWLAPLSSEQLTPPTAAALKELGLLGSDYFQLLARDLPILQERTRTDHGIFFTQGGLPRAERELAATVTSKVNGCIFCASVHAARATHLAKRGEDVERLLQTAPGQPLDRGQTPRWAAQIDVAAHLAVTPVALTHDHLAPLIEQGLDTLQLLDLVQCVAFFSWANRLMLTLGEPFWRAS